METALLGCDAGGRWNRGEGYGRECGRTDRKRCASRCCSAPAAVRFRVPIGQHKRFGAQGAPAALHFLEPQRFQQHGLGFGAGCIASEGNRLIVDKQARAGLLGGEGHESSSRDGSGFSGGLEFGELALGRGGLLREQLGLPPGFGCDCRLGSLLQIEAGSLGNVNLGFGPAPACERPGQQRCGQEQGCGRNTDLGDHAAGHDATRRDGNLFPYAHD